MPDVNQGTPIPTLPYVVSYNRWLRTFAIAYAVFVVWLLVLARDSGGRVIVAAVWEREGWLIRTGLVLAFVTVPGILLEMFVEKLIFARGHIMRRNALGRWQEYPYDEVAAVEVFPGEMARIRLRDGRKLKIWAAMANLTTVEAIVRARATAISTANQTRENKAHQ